MDLDVETVVAVGHETLRIAFIVSAPLMGVGLVVGVIISIFMAVTQINEMTLSFVPKILAMMAALYISLPWILRLMIDYTERLFEDMADLFST